MRDVRWSRTLRHLLVRGAALLVIVPAFAFGLGLATGSSAGAGTPARSEAYGGGRLMAADPAGGYWMTGPTGTVTPEGGAPALGSPAQSGLQLARPIVGMAPTPDGGGYWLVASDGGIFSYGDATFYGSTGSIHLNQPIVGMAPTPDSQGYWLVAADGGVFTFGDAGYYGSSAGTGVTALGLVVQPASSGYAVVTSNGTSSYYGPPASPGHTTTSSGPSATGTATGPARTTTPAPSSTPSPATSGLLLGSYNGAANPAGDAAFASETGTTASIYSDYLDGSSWSSMVGAPGSPPWVISSIKGKLGSERLLLSVPLVNAGYSSDQAALAAYAGNPAQWDAGFTTLAQNLVADGFSNAIIRLMWEPDSGIYSNDDLTSAHNYAVLWQDAYTAMMGVSGAGFQWAWYWGGNFDATTNATAYPGNAYVNYVTFDFYDQSWDGSCGIPYNGSNFTAAQEACLWSGDFDGLLGGLSSFASAHGKPIGIGEFGVIDRSDGHGGGDDPTFINDFAAWMKSNNVAWASYFNFNSGGNSILSDYPNSLAAYRADLG